MSKRKALGIMTDRANAGLRNDIIEQIADAYFVDGLSMQEAIDQVQDALVQKALDRYSDKIRAALARAGLTVEGDLSVESITAAIAEKSGLEITDLSPDGMVTAADKLAAKRLSAELGIEVASVMQGNLEQSLIEGVRAGLQNGSIPLVGARLTKQARAEMTWRREGFENAEDRRKVNNAIYQKRYRRRNKEVWITRVTGDEQP